MINAGTLFRARSTQQERAARRTGRIAAAALALSALVVTLVYLGVGALALHQAWLTTQWDDFWGSGGMLAVFALLPLALFASGLRGVFHTSAAATPDTGLAVREALIAGDPTLAPPVILQPAPVAAHELSSWPLRVGPLRHPANTPSSAVVTIVAATLFPFIFLLCAIPSILIGPGESWPYTPLTIGAGVLAFFALVIVAAITGSVVARRNRLTVVADDQGLHWEDGRGRRRAERFIAWTQVRSLTRAPLVTSTTSSGSSGTATFGQRLAYMVDGGDAVLQWMSLPAGQPDEFAASELLLRVVVTRTGKPLRDLSTLLAELAQAGKHAPRVLENRVPSLKHDEKLASVFAPPAKKRRLRWGWALYALVAVLALGSLYGGGAWLQHYQSRYFAGLPARVHATPPLTHSDLRGDVAQGWYPAGMDPCNGTYIASPGGYALTGASGDAMLALYSDFRGANGAFEVTATQSGTLTENGGDGVGVILRSDANGTDFLTYMVGYDGSWSLYRYDYKTGRSSDDWNYITGGSSAAIYTNPGDTNTLLVIARDKLFLFYVNGQYIGSYYARYESLSNGSYAGVYLDDGALTGTFTDFSAYPTPPLFAYGSVQISG